MNLDQQTIEKTPDQETSEKISELRQEAMKLNDEISEMSENGSSEGDPVLTYTKNKLSEVLKELSTLEGSPMEVAENIVENQFNSNEGVSDTTQQEIYHNKLLSKATELKRVYEDKKLEAESNLKNLVSGTPEYVVTENLISQYDKQIQSGQSSIDANKKALETLQKTA